MGAIHKGMSRTKTFAGYSDLEVEVCANCGVLFALPARMMEALREDGSSFYCPSGHSLSFDGDISRLKKDLQQAKDRAAAERAKRDQAEASLRATKGVVTKLKKRGAAGVCPAGCRRHFENLERHMKSQHPDFSEKPTP